ncbi:probable ATP-dependent RNA helicase vasa-like isoform X3 [Nematostella vectensis]|uniref:probable ATP-dependent RNA helicase vasa-like isoform X2 n=1 Tax=Nematostella vectensis TaxID=45351 RepID=UPI002076F624|nr:probable ATP-dependent RNA helicase vasa-like isoform X2 [Nematostella vectensis]XP_032232166.2 probable ATP-dependent RNA helicase vasa-like isoform X3 [Nematostella vectensis]
MSWPSVTDNSRMMNGGSHFGGDGGRADNRQTEHKVYAANIPVSMTQESVEALFSKHGHVISARILPPKQGRNSTVAFIGYATEEAALDAISALTGCELGGRYPLRVSWPANKNKPQPSGGGGGGGDCHQCGEAGHFSRECPNKGNQGFSQEQSRPSPFASQEHNQTSPFARTMDDNAPSKSSPFGGPSSNTPHPNQLGSSFVQPNQNNTFMSMLGRGESMGQAPPSQPGGLQNYNAPQSVGYLQSSKQGYDQQGFQQGQAPGYSSHIGNDQQHIPHQQGKTEDYHKGPSYNQPVFNGGYQGPQNQGFTGNQYSQQPQQGYNQPSNPGYQEPPTMNVGQMTQQGYQSDSQGYQQQNQGFQQQNQGYQQHDQGFQQQNQGYQQQNQGFQQQNQGYNQQLTSSTYQEPSSKDYSQSNGPSTDSPYQKSPFGYGSSGTTGRSDRDGGGACHRCGQEGHFSRDCPNPPTRQGGGRACHKCGEEGHFARECPNQPSQGGGRACHKCGEEGHFARECPNQPSQGGWCLTCHKCREEGHYARDCPNQPSQGMGGGGACHKCGKEGHFSRECPNQDSQRIGGGRNCHKCGQEGHFSRECPNQAIQGIGGGRACHNCRQEGHFSRECPNQANQGSGTCHKCGEVGHFARECPTGRGQSDTCHKCGETGHYSRECPTLGNGGMDPNRPPPITYIPPELPDNIDLLFQDAPHTGIKFDNYENIPSKVSGENQPPKITSFNELPFGEQLMANISRAGYRRPTPVQKAALPIVMAGRDLMACAQTGSGKTAAYMLPVLTSLIKQGLNAPPRSPLALCVAPTRELAKQIYIEARKFSDHTPIKVCVCYGGVSVPYQASQLERGCHFLVGTPGRLQDFVSREQIYLGSIQHLILDEADRMLDLGFGPDIHKLIEESNMTAKESRQTLMFSATFPDEIQHLAGSFLKPDYLFLAVGRVGGTNLDITQHVITVNGSEKRDKLHEILSATGTDRTLVFVELKRVADFLAAWLSQNNFPTTSISSDRCQSEREAALRDFRDGRANILVATSVAARGLDIPNVKHVINYDLPQDIEEYVHRVGRTGRIGNEGKATAFYEVGRDDRLARSLVKVLSEALQEVPAWLEEAAEVAFGTSYGPAGGRYGSKDTRERGSGGRGQYQGNMQSITTGISNLQVKTSPASFQAPRQYSQPQAAHEEDDEDWN